MAECRVRWMVRNKPEFILKGKDEADCCTILETLARYHTYLVNNVNKGGPFTFIPEEVQGEVEVLQPSGEWTPTGDGVKLG